MVQTSSTGTHPDGTAPNRSAGRGLARLRLGLPWRRSDRGGGESTGAGGKWRGSGKWRRGIVLAVLALLIGVVLLFHEHVPNRIGNLGSLVETFLPWIGLGVPVLLACALLRRSVTALIALLLPVVVWANLFGNLVLPGKGGGPHNLRVLTHNVDAANPDPLATARDLLAADADIVALEELTEASRPVYEKALKAKYPYHARGGTQGGTVELWSRYKITSDEPLDVGFGWIRALRAQVTTPEGPVRVYVAHLASVRVDSTGFTSNQRNRTTELLGEKISQDPLKRIVVMGDLNGTANDRSLSPITSGLRSAQGAAGDGFGFSWPAGFPMARIDHILVRGVTPSRSWVLPETGSDHRPVAADLDV